MQSNKEMTIYGDLEVLLLLRMDRLFGNQGYEDIISTYFSKDRKLIESLKEDDELDPLPKTT